MKMYARAVCMLLVLCVLSIGLSACTSREMPQNPQENEGLSSNQQTATGGNAGVIAASQGLFEEIAYGYFLEISKIPRGSDNEQEVSDYLVAFAKENGLEVKQDSALNVLISKPGSEGREDEAPVVLQAHMDMVCEKNEGVEHDFSKDPIIPVIDGDWVKAEGTTLGADGAAGVVMIMAILSANNLSHPPIEAIITANEEGGQGPGASGFDVTQLKAKRFINVDSEQESALTVSCAGTAGSDVIISAEYEAIPDNFVTYQLMVKGLTGGHSAMDIDKNRANAIILMARVLDELDDGAIYLTRIDGGTADNAIPRECTADISFDEKDLDKIQSALTHMQKDLKENEYPLENITFTLKKTETAQNVLGHDSLRRVIDCILTTPNGVQTMSPNFEGLVQTSSSMGIVFTEETNGNVEIVLYKMLRSSVEADMSLLIEEMDTKAKNAGASSSYGSLWNHPWEYKEDSVLRDTMVSIYKDVYGRDPIVTGVHGFLECAIFAENMPDCDFISMGPTIEGAHSPDERMSLSSFNRTCNYFVKVLEKL